MEILLHGHHRGLLSVVESAQARIDHIKCNKPEGEHALRLRLLQVVPLSELPKAVVKACEAWDKAWDEVRVKERVNVHIACADYKVELEALHKKLCVAECPWDGERILPDQGAK